MRSARRPSSTPTRSAIAAATVSQLSLDANRASTITSALLQGSARYQQALGTGDDVAAFANGLKRGGYATDPAYVEKLTATAGHVRALRADAT